MVNSFSEPFLGPSSRMASSLETIKQELKFLKSSITRIENWTKKQIDENSETSLEELTAKSQRLQSNIEQLELLTKQCYINDDENSDRYMTEFENYERKACFAKRNFKKLKRMLSGSNESLSSSKNSYRLDERRSVAPSESVIQDFDGNESVRSIDLNTNQNHAFATSPNRNETNSLNDVRIPTDACNNTQLGNPSDDIDVEHVNPACHNGVKSRDDNSDCHNGGKSRDDNPACHNGGKSREVNPDCHNGGKSRDDNPACHNGGKSREVNPACHNGGKSQDDNPACHNGGKSREVNPACRNGGKNREEELTFNSIANDGVSKEKQTQHANGEVYFNNRTTFESLHSSKDNCSHNHIPNCQNCLKNVKINETIFHQTKVKLPSISIPNFDGDKMNWLNFRDLFVSSFHNNSNLSNSEKLRYLKGYLTGSAALLLKNYAITDNNYYSAWEKLNNRYNKSNNLIFSFIDRFLNIEYVNSDLNNIQSVYDEADDIIRSLKTLSTYSGTLDPWLIHLLLRKFDFETKRLWATKVFELNHEPSFDDFLRYLDGRCDSVMSLVSHKTKTKKIFSNVVQNSQCLKCKADHELFQCDSFKKLNLNEKFDFVKSVKVCFNCLRSGHNVNKCSSKTSCLKCSKRHHTFLHFEKKDSNSNNDQSNPSIASNSCPISGMNFSILPSVLVNLFDISGFKIACRAVLDTGSQASFIKESLVNKLKLKKYKVNIPVSGIGNVNVTTCRSKVVIKLFSRFDERKCVSVEALVIPNIMNDLSSFDVPSEFVNLDLADQNYNLYRQVDMILESGISIDIWEDSVICINDSKLKARKSLFGWVIYNHPATISNVQVNAASSLDEDNIENILRKFWSLESVPERLDNSDDHTVCENIFVLHHNRDQTGRYVVHLPFKMFPPNIGDSLEIAKRQFKYLEQRFSRDSVFKSHYVKFMRDYISSGHMVKVEHDNQFSNLGTCYLPHHGILKNGLKGYKFRTVFNASCKTSNHISLNDCLMVGNNLQSDPVEMILRSRKHRFIMVADIEQMFRQILVDKKHTDYQRILWREDENENLESYCLSTVTYGTSCAPFLAIRVLKQLALDEAPNFPNAVKILNHDTYMDDMIFGGEELEDVTKLRNELLLLMKSAGFNLKKWATNSKSLLSGFKDSDCSISINEFNSNACLKILGIKWYPKDDYFTFDINFNDSEVLTKRQFLSVAAKIYDPLGFLSPVTVLLKQMFQTLSSKRCKLGWDDKLTSEFLDKWTKIQSQFSLFSCIQIPRYIFNSNINRYELHGFCDSSQKSYAAVIYIKSINSEKCVVNLLIAKTKVAPLTSTSIPRLELCGALLLSKLIDYCVKALGVEFHTINCWSDSKVVLAWLKKDPSQLKTFVANRVRLIQQLLSKDVWHYVESKENPADIASRGVLPNLLLNSSWFSGPSWLLKEFKLNENSFETTEDVKPLICNNCSIDYDNIYTLVEKSSSFSFLLRVVAFVIKFINITRKRSLQSNLIDTKEIENAQLCLIRNHQNVHFSDEIKCCISNREFPKNSKLKGIAIILDENKVIRLNSRIINSKFTPDVISPVVLDSSHLSKLIVRYYHLKYLHSGVELTINIVRQRFWILRLRSIVKHTIQTCTNCIRFRNSKKVLPLGNLPNYRLKVDFPFVNTGIDYAGPVSLRPMKCRGNFTTKGYIAVFVCLVTKAIHLEVAMSLDVESFMSAFRKFISRRGLCSLIISDNGRNFVGASNELNQLGLLLNSNDLKKSINNFTSELGITWKFIPAYTPHFGGLWETTVKSVKSHLKKTFLNKVLTIENFNTVLCEIEALLNSRPLVSLKEDFEKPTALTPGHFLIGRNFTFLMKPEKHHNKTFNSNFKNLQCLIKGFWDQWRLDYLNVLKSKNSKGSVQTIEVGDIVIIKRPYEAPSDWSLGKILKLFPGPDKIVRVADVLAKGKIFRESLKNLIMIPSKCDYINNNSPFSPPEENG